MNLAASSLVPIPADVRVTEGEHFDLREPFALEGDSAASVLFTALLAAHGTPRSDATRTITFRQTDGGAPESYRLRADASAILVEGTDAAGLQHGVHTLAQLITTDGTIPAVEIADAPRFAHRGLMLDVARHFFPVEVIERLIDRAAALKLNALHLHLSDDQGWRLALRSHPELAAQGAGSAARGDAGGHYSREDYARIVAHAASRHLTVIPEIDVPGHTHALGLSHPELVTEPVLSDAVLEVVAEHGGGIPAAGKPYTGFAVGFSSLRTHDEATYALLADVFGELAELTPGPYLHFGGDESLGTSAEDYAAFIARASGIVAATGKTPIAWHEAGAVPGLARGTVGQYWGFLSPTDGMDDDARAFVANGGRLILSPADAVYLDMKDAPDTPLGLTWANAPTTVERAYSWEPTEIIDGVSESDILGVEAALWTETIATEAELETMVFPRLAAAAEVAWSPPASRSWDSFRERLAQLAIGWEADGIRFTRTAGVAWRS